MPDDQTSTPGESESGSPVNVPSHDTLPLPPEVHYTRPVLKQGGLLGSGPISGDSRHGSAPSWGNAAQSRGGSSSMSGWGRGLSVSVTFAASIAAGYLIGQWMDRRLFHDVSQGYGTLIMTIAGFGVGIFNVMRLTGIWNKDSK